ncbi:acyltransferase [Kocuria sabuli]|uniref:acyltransferase family protein n=1 Tax=Kocuria sabuli TaxID=3071448 RepID=UPI0034D3CC41
MTTDPGADGAAPAVPAGVVRAFRDGRRGPAPPPGAGVAETVRAPGPAAVPAQRDLVLDAARTGCLLVVVLVHLLMVTVTADPGTGGPATVMVPTQQPWYWWATWILQVMPLFFVLGGHASVLSWRRHTAHGGDAAGWVRARALRLLRPAAVLWAVLALGCGAALAAGAPPELVRTVVQGMGMPLWFLAAYLACQALLPLTAGWHGRAPGATAAGLLAAVVAVDALRIGTGAAWVGLLNLVLVWPLVQQLGFLRADGWFERRRPAQLLAGGGLCFALLAGLVATGRYAPDMLANLNPATVCMVLLGVAQACLLQLAAPALGALMRTRPARLAAWAVGGRAMTVYLWHLPVIVAVAAVWFLAGGPDPQPGSAAWWAWRVPLGAVVAVVLAVVSVPLVRAERRPVALPPGDREPAAPVVVLAVLLGFLPPFLQISWWLSPVLALAGAVLTAVAVALLRRGRPAAR